MLFCESFIQKEEKEEENKTYYYDNFKRLICIENTLKLEHLMLRKKGA